MTNAIQQQSHFQPDGSKEAPQGVAPAPLVDVTNLLEGMQRLCNAYLMLPGSALVVSGARSDLMEKLRAGRMVLQQVLLSANVDLVRRIVKHNIVRLFGFTGLLHQPLTQTEKVTAETTKASFVEGWDKPHSANFFAITMLYCQAYELPIVTKGFERLDPEIQQAYLDYCVAPPVFVERGDDQKYADHMVRFLNWLTSQINSPIAQPWLLPRLNAICQNMDICAMLNSEVDIYPVAQARARFLLGVNNLIESKQIGAVPKFTRKAQSLVNRKARIGYMVSAIEQGPDMQVVLAEIGGFDPEKVEVYLYSKDMRGITCYHDVRYYRRLFAKVTEVRSLQGLSTEKLVNLVRKDDLDIFIYNSATHFGFGFYDMLMLHRVAPVQIVPNRVAPISSWLDSFDYHVLPRVSDETFAKLVPQASEKLMLTPGAAQAYDQSDAAVVPVHPIDKATLGLGEKDIVLLCCGAAPKLTPTVCDVYAQILSKVPHGKLILACLHPAFGGESLLPVLALRMESALKRHAVNPDRVVYLNKMEACDMPQLLSFADVYLHQWPMGGATWIIMSLQAAVPSVVMDSDLFHGLGNQSLMRGAGFDGFVVGSEDAYIQLVVKLAVDKEINNEARRKLKEARPKMLHNDTDMYSQQMQSLYLDLIDKSVSA